MNTFRIGDHILGPGHPTFIIAEAGVNHNGSKEIAFQLIDAAADAGADAVKFQTFKAKDGSTRAVQKVGYQAKNTGDEGSMYDMIVKLEFEYAVFHELKDYADQKGIVFLSTPHTPDASPFLADLVPAFKMGSGDLNNLPFLAQTASYGLPMILGTGMGTMDEIKEALAVIREAGTQDIAFLHCTTSYPCPYEDVNLRAMLQMQEELDCMIGYSDHTAGITVPVMAVALGAHIIEKHYTLDKGMEGPDHKASLEPHELKAMVQGIREAEKSMGRREKRPTESEIEVMGSVRKSVVANVAIPAGTLISEDMLIIKRPGTGIQPKDLGNVVGKTAARDIAADTLVQMEDLK